ncbi:hypothetical protein [Corynebacterium macginleyi]|uniref:hypothetical protein n=1 Tax=Corynebacterium macginleyi TaxID=38290 RepID=UPI00217D380E|nr:hypothetical protein [Corynebacterium macginleyi]
MTASQGTAQFVTLAPGCGVFCREKSVVQFGMDATRVAVADTGNAQGVARAFATAHQPVDSEELAARLEAAGLDSVAANSLIEDTLAYGILWPQPPQPTQPETIIMLGESPLAMELRARLHTDGYTVRIPLDEDNIFSYIHDLDGLFTVLAIDQLHCPIDCANALAGTPTTWLPVSLLDNRGIIGPLRVEGQGPCPLCIHLHRVDADPQWTTIASQLTKVRRQPEKLVIDAVAAQAQVVIRRLSKRPLPPGAPTAFPRPGQQWEVDVYGRHQQRTAIAHPRCPVCFGGKVNLSTTSPIE